MSLTFGTITQVKVECMNRGETNFSGSPKFQWLWQGAKYHVWTSQIDKHWRHSQKRLQKYDIRDMYTHYEISGYERVCRWWSCLSLLTRVIKLSRKAVISNINNLYQCFQDKSAISCLHPHSTPIQSFLKSSKKNLNRYKFYNKLFKQPDHRVEFDTPLHSKNVLFQKIANNLNWMNVK